MTIMTANPVATYRDRVATALADVPVDERAEALDGVTEHLAEVTRELGSESMAALEARLGTPEQYAGELRAAAGYQPPPQAAGAQIRPTLALIGVVLSTILLPVLMVGWAGIAYGRPIDEMALMVALGLLPSALGLWCLRGRSPRMVADLAICTRTRSRGAALVQRWPSWLRTDLREVGQPVWWALRGAIIGAAVAIGLIYPNARNTALRPFVLPVLLGVIASVWAARQAQRDRRWLWLLVPLNAAVMVCLLLVALAGTSFWTGGHITFRGYYW